MLSKNNLNRAVDKWSFPFMWMFYNYCMPKQKQEIDKVHVLMPREMRRKLKSKLALKGQSLSSWVREKTKQELQSK